MPPCEGCWAHSPLPLQVLWVHSVLKIGGWEARRVQVCRPSHQLPSPGRFQSRKGEVVPG